MLPVCFWRRGDKKTVCCAPGAISIKGWWKWPCEARLAWCKQWFVKTVGVCLKLVQVIDRLCSVTLLKDFTLSTELLLKPLLWANSVALDCKFLAKRPEWLRLKGNTTTFSPSIFLIPYLKTWLTWMHQCKWALILLNLTFNRTS